MAIETYPVQVTGSLSRWTPLAEIRALLAVTRKSWLNLIRYPSWLISIWIWPLIFPAGYLLTARALAGPDGSSMAIFTQVTGYSDFVGYIGIGTTVWMWQNMILWDVGYALRGEQMRGTLESNWLTPTWRFSYLIGNSVVEFFTILMFMLVGFLEFSLLLGVRFQGNLLLVALMILVSIPSIYGIGFTFASLVVYAKEANSFVYLVRGMVMIFCGITYPISVMPDWMQVISKWLPPTYAIRGLRNALLSGADIQMLLPDIEALVGFGVFWMVVGYFSFKWMDRRACRTGALGQF